MFESLFGTISDFLINGKLNQDSKKKYYDKYIEIGCALADRIKEQLINENFVRTGESGGKVLHLVPDWFGKIDFISSLTFGAAEIQRNKLETLHLFSLFKKTTIQRKYANQHSPGKKGSDHAHPKRTTDIYFEFQLTSHSNYLVTTNNIQMPISKSNCNPEY